MSVEKPNFTEILKENIPFTTFQNELLQKITSPIALAIYVYLASLPEKWNVNRHQLMKHFSMGRDKLDKALCYLVEHKLLEYLWIKNENGTVKKVVINVKNGKDFIKYINNQQHNTTTLKTRIVAKKPRSSTTLKIHSVDNQQHIKENKKIKKKKREQEQKPVAAAPPLSIFEPDQQNTIQAKDMGLVLHEEVKSFIQRHRGSKTQYEFSRWLQHAKAYKDKKKGQERQEVRCTVPEYGPGHPAWEMRHGKKDSHGRNEGTNRTRVPGMQQASDCVLL